MKTADLILTNGRVFTLDPVRPWARGIAIAGDRVLDTGSIDEIAVLQREDTEVIDLMGKVVIPGLTDSHIHLALYGMDALFRADLSGCRSIEEMQKRLRAFDAERSPEWIIGCGFDHEIFAEKRFPTREELDEVSRDKPVIVVRLCGHAVVVNSAAIAAGDADRLPESGRTTGLLTEDDQDPVFDHAPAPTMEQRTEAILFAAEKARATGITAIHFLIGRMEEYEILKRLHAEGRLPIRVYVQVPYSIFPQFAEQGLKTGHGDEMLRIGSVKMFQDGSMGAWTAGMREPYTDRPETSGLLMHTQEELTEMVRKVHNAGWQAAVHAIGDLAIETVINAYETVLTETGEDNRVRRHRVEHASILAEDLIQRMARLHILTAVQPQFVLTDFWTINRVGPERYRWTYPFRTLIESGVPTSLGSDCPVERLDAFELIYRAVTRDAHSQSECLAPEETVRLYALGGAYASFQEKTRGSLEPGMLADMVVLDTDIFKAEAPEILTCRPSLIVLGGRKVRP